MRAGLLDLPRYRELGKGWGMRLLSAREEMECRREGEALSSGEEDSALCANACLLAKALVKKGKPVFADGRDVLERLSAGQIGELARQWGEFDRECDPAPWDDEALERAKKAWSTRLMSAFSGACSKRSGRCPPRNGQRT